MSEKHEIVKSNAPMDRPDCYKCVHRGEVPGSAHSRCKHPAFASASANPLNELFAIFASVGRVGPVQYTTPACKVKGNPHVIRNGWFNHPYNFDPVWWEECSGFTPSKEE